MGFFKPPRRKVGVLTLFMACVFATGWVRSNVHEDNLGIGFVTAHDHFFSRRQYLGWTRFRSASGPLKYQTGWYSQPVRLISLGFISNSTEQGWSRLGFDFETGRFLEDLLTGQVIEGKAPIEWVGFTVPYWSVVIPLTLISLWLLLFKPRQSNSDKITEPIPNEGT